MPAIERCAVRRWGAVFACDACAQVQIAYNSCRNRHCPKCQASAAKRWLEAAGRPAAGQYYHLVFTLPAPISAIAYYNKTVIYDLLFAVAAESLHARCRRSQASRRRSRRDVGPARLGIGTDAPSACAWRRRRRWPRHRRRALGCL